MKARVRAAKIKNVIRLMIYFLAGNQNITLFYCAAAAWKAMH